jgi:hypothetical protein
MVHVTSRKKCALFFLICPLLRIHDTHVIAGIPNGEDQLVDYREQFPFNYGCMASVKIIADPDGMVNYTFPSAVPGGNVETSPYRLP